MARPLCGRLGAGPSSATLAHRIAWDEPPPPATNIRSAHDHAALDFNRAASRIHDAREFDEQAVARCFHNTATVLGDCWIEELATVRLELRQGTFLIGPHQPAVARHVGGENGS
jgi:hypothetical protein